MKHRWPGAKLPIPTFRTSGSQPKFSVLSRFCRTSRPSVNQSLIREVIRIKSITNRRGQVYEAYAGCDRAPINWENVR